MYIPYEHLCHFDSINCDLLEKEWIKAVEQNVAGKKHYKRITVNSKGLALNQNLQDYSVNTISDEFLGSYTEQVIREIIEPWFNQRGLRSTKIKFAELPRMTGMDPHVDKYYEYRYHLVITTNSKCSFTIDEQEFPLGPPGSFVRMYAATTHAAKNFGDSNRLLLTFDVTAIGENNE